MSWELESRFDITAIVEVDGDDITTIGRFSDPADAELFLKAVGAVRAWDKWDGCL